MFCLFLSGCFTRVLLYWPDDNSNFMFAVPNKFKTIYRPNRYKNLKQGHTSVDASTLIWRCLTLGVCWEEIGKSENIIEDRYVHKVILGDGP